MAMIFLCVARKSVRARGIGYVARYRVVVDSVKGGRKKSILAQKCPFVVARIDALLLSQWDQKHD